MHKIKIVLCRCEFLDGDTDLKFDRYVLVQIQLIPRLDNFHTVFENSIDSMSCYVTRDPSDIMHSHLYFYFR